MRIVQLSDIHLSKENLTDFKNFYRDAIIKDLLLFHKIKKIDVILLTGDLVDRGGNSLGKDPYKIFNKEFVRPMLDELGMRDDQLFFIPGNHDVDRDSIQEENEVFLTSKLNTSMANNLLLKMREKFTSANKRIKKFKVFERKFQENNSNYNFSNNESVAVTDSDGKKIGFALINDSWRCSDELQQECHFYGFNQLYNANNIFKSAGTVFNIAVFHHPLEVMSTTEKEETETILKTGNFDVAIFGHKHDFEFDSIISPNGGYISMHGRTAFGKAREVAARYQSGYSILDINISARSYELHARKYLHKRHEFDKDVESMQDGFHIGPIPAKNNFVSLAGNNDSPSTGLPHSYKAEVNRIVTLLIGKSLYQDHLIFVRELIQNSVDACSRAQEKHTHNNPQITILINTEKNYIEISDEGDGMTKSVLKNHFAVIGQSISQEFNESNGNFNLISQFGIGFISTFIVAQNVIIYSKNEADDAIKFEINDVFKGFNYDVPDSIDLLKPVTGTTVRVYLKKGYSAKLLLGQVRRYCRHIDNLDIFLDGEKLQNNSNWNVETSSYFHIDKKDKFELRLGLGPQTRPIVASNCGFLINAGPIQLTPFKFPFYIGGEVNFRPKSIDFDMSRSNVIEGDKALAFRRDVSVALRKLFRQALEAKDVQLRPIICGYLQYYLIHFEPNLQRMQQDYKDFYSKKELVELCAKHTYLYYAGFDRSLEMIFEIIKSKGFSTIFITNGHYSEDSETVYTHYLEDSGRLVVHQNAITVNFRDGASSIPITSVVQILGKEYGLDVVTISNIYQSKIHEIKLDKKELPIMLLKQFSHLEKKHQIEIDLASFRPWKPSVKLGNNLFLNNEYPAFKRLLESIDKVDEKTILTYLSGMLGLEIEINS